MRSRLALLLLFGAVIGVHADPPECARLYELPMKDTCFRKIKWKVHTNEQATATCLEYFPTTFVKGEKLDGPDEGFIKCTVEAAYQCIEPDTFLMYDKCYKFPKIAGKYDEGTIDDYTGANKKCGAGKLSVFYSYTQAKFLGMKAKELGFDKLWIGITSDGKSIEEPDKLIHSELWKLVGGDYWDADSSGSPVLKVLKPNENLPAAANYIFMRTRNDEFNRRYQGSFERATNKIKARFACEFEAKFTRHQKWYCDRMQSLGLDAQFDSDYTAKPRCLYVTASKYTWKGTAEDLPNIKGCQERPSDLHSSGLDDGTAHPNVYKRLSHQMQTGRQRLAGYYVKHIVNDPNWASYAQGKCEAPVTNEEDRKKLFMKWRHFEHKGKSKLAATCSLKWDSAYPKNECSDFPGESSTLGLRKGQMIDVPPEVRMPAICSLIFFQECENRISPCGAKLECRNSNKFEPVTGGNPASGFFTCHCPGEGYAHDKVESGGQVTCNWKGSSNTCVYFSFSTSSYSTFFPPQQSWLFLDKQNDMMQQAVVKEGCKLSVEVHAPWKEPNYILLNEVPYGSYQVPNSHDHSLAGDLEGLGASSYKCTC